MLLNLDRTISDLRSSPSVLAGRGVGAISISPPRRAPPRRFDQTLNRADRRDRVCSPDTRRAISTSRDGGDRGPAQRHPRAPGPTPSGPRRERSGRPGVSQRAGQARRAGRRDQIALTGLGDALARSARRAPVPVSIVFFGERSGVVRSAHVGPGVDHDPRRRQRSVAGEHRARRAFRSPASRSVSTRCCSRLRSTRAAARSPASKCRRTSCACGRLHRADGAGEITWERISEPTASAASPTPT